MPLNGKPQVHQIYQSSLTNCDLIEIILTEREQGMAKGKIVQIIQCFGRKKAENNRYVVLEIFFKLKKWDPILDKIMYLLRPNCITLGLNNTNRFEGYVREYKRNIKQEYIIRDDIYKI